VNKGIVIGEVFATKKNERIRGYKLLLVCLVDDMKRPTQRVVVAVDTLDAGVSDEVVVAFGSGARNAIKPLSRDVLVDCAIVQVIEGSNIAGGT
jgi:ethanolamine utilization protein EutN